MSIEYLQRATLIIKKEVGGRELTKLWVYSLVLPSQLRFPPNVFFPNLKSTLCLRAACFGWAIELYDNLEEHQVLCIARARGISTATYYSTLVADPPVQI